MSLPALPTTSQLRTLPSYFEQTVPEEFIDDNGHMNIGDYFRLGAWAPWKRLTELGLGERYIPERGLSFFTVEHHIRYVGELLLGERFCVRTGFAGRTAKAVHGVSFIVDEERGRIACVLEVMYVHVSMQTRRAVAIPDDIADLLDTEIGTHSWVTEAATGLSLRR